MAATDPLRDVLEAALFSAYSHGLVRFVRDADEPVVAAFIANYLAANGVTLKEPTPVLLRLQHAEPLYTEDDPDWAAMVSPISDTDGGHDDR